MRILRGFALLITAGGALCAQTITTNPVLPNAVVGLNYSPGVQFIVIGFAGPATWSLTPAPPVNALPANMSLSPSGFLAGIPNLAGVYSFSVRASQNGQFVDKSFQLTVQQPLVLSPATLPTGTVNVTYPIAGFGASGGTTPYTFVIATGTYPAGLGLNAATGAITGVPTATGNFTFGIRVTDALGYTNTVTYNVRITTPLVLGPGTLPNAPQNASYVQQFTESGGQGPYTLSFSAGTPPPGLSFNNSSAQLLGNPTTQGSYTFTVQLSDSVGSPPASIQYSLKILPPLILSPGSLPTGSVGVTYPVPGFTASGGTTPYTFSLPQGALPTGLNLVASTGAITGTPQVVGLYSFYVTVTDALGYSTTITSYSVRITNPLVLAPPAVPNAVQNLPYSQQLTLSGGVSPYTVSVVSGALPNGVSPNASTGLISGTPTVAGTFPFTIQLNDSVGSPSVSIAYSLLVQPPLVLSPATLPSGTVGVNYSSTFTTAGGNGNYVYQFAGLANPPGLSLLPTGIISGSPTTAGSYTFPIKVTDGQGYSITSNVSITIYKPLGMSPSSTDTTEVGIANTISIFAFGGQPPYNFTIVSGSLPPGLLLNSSTGVASGTPTTQGSYTWTVQLTDSVGTPPATQTYSRTVLAQLGVSPATLPAGTLTFPYSATIFGTGGQPRYFLSQPGGTLPSGLTFNTTTGVISGTPTQTGLFSVTFQVMDNLEYSASLTYTLLITAPLTIAPTTLSNMIAGKPFSQTLTSTGGSGAINWSIEGGLPNGLTLNAATGLISGTPTTSGAYNFTVQVTDSVGTTPAIRNYSGSVIAALSIVTNALPAGTQGVSYSATLVSAGGLAPITWTLDGGTMPGGLTLNGTTGVISGIPTAASTASIVVDAHDSAGQVSTKTFSFNIITSLAIQTPALNPITTNVPYTMQLVASGGQGTYTWTIVSGNLPPGLTMSASGLITGTVTVDTNSNAVIKVTDSAGNTDSRSYAASATTPIPALTVTTTSLPNGNVGASYNSALAASGGQGSYRWSISQGALPDGLQLNPSGQISGTPGTAGTFNFGVLVTDGSTRGAGRLLFITIDPALAPLTITTASVPDTDLNAAYSASVAATGGKSPYTFSVAGGALPPGITFNGQGALSGAGTTAGAYTFTIQVQDAVGTKVSKDFALNVLAPLSITTTSLAAGNVGIAYSAGVAATGGKQPYKFSIASGSLPTGLSMDSSGAITGKPTTAGSFSFTAQVDDSSKKTASKALTIRIIDTLAILTTSPLPEVVQNQSYSVTCTATGGTSPYTWSQSAGTMPPGLSLNASTGELSGKPTSAANFSLTIQVKDAQGLTASSAFALNVVPTLAITATQVPNGTVGSAYSASLAVSGGTPAITWSLSAGALPAGLTLSSGGAISGTPTVNGSFSFTVQAADSKTQKDSRAFTIAIGLPPVSTVGFTGLADTLPPAQQPVLGVTLGQSFPIALTGTVTLTFVPDSGADDPAVQFTSGGRTAPFSLAAGNTGANFGIVPVGVQTGTVSGSITLTVKLLAGTIDVTPNPAPSKSFRIAKAAPFLRTVTVTRTGAGFDVAITGYVTTREITTAQFHFTSASGITVQAVDFTQQLGPVFNTWFQSAASQPFGSQFTMTQPFTIQGSSTAVTAVSVTLTNSVGTSNSLSANIP